MSGSRNPQFTSAALRSSARSELGRASNRSKELTMMERWIAAINKAKSTEGDDPLIKEVQTILSAGSVDDLRKLQTHLGSTSWMFEP